MKNRILQTYYDRDLYKDFGEQPEILEIAISEELIPVVDKELENNLCDKINFVRNSIEAEFGLIIPPVRIRDYTELEPYEYSILLNGTKVAGFKGLTLKQYLCMDTGDVKEVLKGDYVHIKDPSFGIDGIIIDFDLKNEAEKNGYTCTDLLKVIQVNLQEVIRNNLTKFLNQNVVNTLINKLRPANPDVIDTVFFRNNFTTSKMKTVLNLLLEEKVSICDMNTILETIADNLDKDSSPLFLAERVREKLAYQILSKYADENKVIKVIKLGESVSEIFVDNIYFPKEDENHPYFLIEPDFRKKFIEVVQKELEENRDTIPVFLCVSSLRKAFFDLIHIAFSEAICISDLEIYECNGLYSVDCIGVVDV